MPSRSLADRRRLEGHLALVVVQLCFGLFPVFGHLAFEAFDPRAVATWRIGVGALVLLGVAVLVEGRGVLVGWRDLATLQVLAILGVTANQVLFLEGLARSTAVNAGLIMCLIPVFTLLVAAVVGQETFRVQRACGIALAFAGSLPLFLERSAGTVQLGGDHALGNALMVANCFVYSIYLVASKPLTRRHSPLVLIGWVYALAAWQIPFLLGGADLAPEAADSRAWGSLAFILLAPTVLGYLLNVVALARVDASTTAVYIYAQPLIAIAGGVLVLDERVPPGTRVAAGAIFLGLALVNFRWRKRGAATATPPR